MTPVTGVPMKSDFISLMVQKSPSERTTSVPLNLTGASPGAMTASDSVIHSPSSCLSHSCSFCGAGSFGCPHAQVPPATIVTATAHAADLFMDNLLRSLAPNLVLDSGEAYQWRRWMTGVIANRRLE